MSNRHDTLWPAVELALGGLLMGGEGSPAPAAGEPLVCAVARAGEFAEAVERLIADLHQAVNGAPFEAAADAEAIEMLYERAHAEARAMEARVHSGSQAWALLLVHALGGVGVTPDFLERLQDALRIHRSSEEETRALLNRARLRLVTRTRSPSSREGAAREVASRLCVFQALAVHTLGVLVLHGPRVQAALQALHQAKRALIEAQKQTPA